MLGVWRGVVVCGFVSAHPFDIMDSSPLLYRGSKTVAVPPPRPVRRQIGGGGVESVPGFDVVSGF